MMNDKKYEEEDSDGDVCDHDDGDDEDNDEHDERV